MFRMTMLGCGEVYDCSQIVPLMRRRALLVTGACP